jgi:hypothetical protein
MHDGDRRGGGGACSSRHHLASAKPRFVAKRCAPRYGKTAEAIVEPDVVTS